MSTKFRLLGDIEVIKDGQLVAIGPPRQRQLLASLLLSAGRTTSRLDLHYDIFDYREVAHSTTIAYITRLRTALRECGVNIVARNDSIKLEGVDWSSVDVVRFRDLIARGSAAMGAGTADQAAEAFEEALSLWRGQPLAGMDSQWADRHRAELFHRRLEATTGLAQARIQLGDLDSALHLLILAAEEYPFDEHLAALQMKVLYGLGRRADALDLFAATRAKLVEQYGVDPGPQLLEVHHQLLNDAIDVRPAVPVLLRRGNASGRREKPLDPSRSPIAGFAHQLRALRKEAGLPTYRQLAGWTGYSATALSGALSGNSLPSKKITLALVSALGGDADDWSRRWELATSAVSHESRAWALPADLRRGRDNWPRPGVGESPGQFVETMRLLRVWAGNPSLRQLQSRSQLPSSTLNDILRRDRLPKLHQLHSFLSACGLPADKHQEWEDAWTEITERTRDGSVSHLTALSTRPPASPTAPFRR